MKSRLGIVAEHAASMKPHTVTAITRLTPRSLDVSAPAASQFLTYELVAAGIQQVFRTRQPLERRINRRDGTAHCIVRALPYSNSRTLRG
jgi:hypothetical protein